MTTTINTPPPAQQYTELPEDFFLKNLTAPTQLDSEGGIPAPSPIPPSPAPTQDHTTATATDDEDEGDFTGMEDPALVADTLVEVADVGMNVLMQFISGESDETMFKVSQAQLAKIKSQVKKLVTASNVKVPPWLGLAILVVAIYAGPAMKAISIRKKKVNKIKAMRNEMDEAQAERVRQVREYEARMQAQTETTPPPRPAPPTKITVSDISLTPDEMPKPNKGGRPPGTTLENGAKGFAGRRARNGKGKRR